MAELADALDLGSSGRPCRFDSCHPQYKSLVLLGFFGGDGCTPSAPGKINNLVTKSSRYLYQRQGGYFLFFILRMETIKP